MTKRLATSTELAHRYIKVVFHFRPEICCKMTEGRIQSVYVARYINKILVDTYGNKNQPVTIFDGYQAEIFRPGAVLVEDFYQCAGQNAYEKSNSFVLEDDSEDEYWIKLNSEIESTQTVTTLNYYSNSADTASFLFEFKEACEKIKRREKRFRVDHAVPLEMFLSADFEEAKSFDIELAVNEEISLKIHRNHYNPNADYTPRLAGDVVDMARRGKKIKEQFDMYTFWRIMRALSKSNSKKEKRYYDNAMEDPRLKQFLGSFLKEERSVAYSRYRRINMHNEQGYDFLSPTNNLLKSDIDQENFHRMLATCACFGTQSMEEGSGLTIFSRVENKDENTGLKYLLGANVTSLKMLLKYGDPDYGEEDIIERELEATDPKKIPQFDFSQHTLCVPTIEEIVTLDRNRFYVLNDAAECPEVVKTEFWGMFFGTRKGLRTRKISDDLKHCITNLYFGSKTGLRHVPT